MEEKTRGLMGWVFSGWKGVVTARGDAFPPEEGIQRRDVKQWQADVQGSY